MHAWRTLCLARSIAPPYPHQHVSGGVVASLVPRPLIHVKKDVTETLEKKQKRKALTHVASNHADTLFDSERAKE
jgi:hypothetical protein